MGLTLAGVAVTMTWLHLVTGGSVALAVVFHAAVNTTTAGTLQLFPPGTAAAGLVASRGCMGRRGRGRARFRSRART